MVKPTASCSIGLAGAGNQEVDTVVSHPPGSDYQGIASGSLYTLMTPDANGVISFSVSGMQANLSYTADSGSAFATLSDQITISFIALFTPNPLGRPDLGDGKNQFVYDTTTPQGYLIFPGAVDIVGGSAGATA